MVPIFKITPICCKEEPLACWEKIGPLEIQNLCFDASGIKISEILDFDVGFGNPINLKLISEKIKKLSGGGHQSSKVVKLRIDENKVIYPNIELIKTFFNWYPKIKFDDGLKNALYDWVNTTKDGVRVSPNIISGRSKKLYLENQLLQVKLESLI